jgi:hypothetical protein
VCRRCQQECQVFAGRQTHATFHSLSRHKKFVVAPVNPGTESRAPCRHIVLISQSRPYIVFLLVTIIIFLSSLPHRGKEKESQNRGAITSPDSDIMAPNFSQCLETNKCKKIVFKSLSKMRFFWQALHLKFATKNKLFVSLRHCVIAS